MSLHDGHRKRMKDRFCTVGCDGMGDHEILEMLLYYVIPRRNTNDEAHRLIERFGSLANVLKASVKELCSVNGIGENTAVYLSLVGSTYKRIQITKSQKKKRLISSDDFAQYMHSLFIGQSNEIAYLLCLDAKSTVIGCYQVGEGGVNSVSFSIRRIIEIAFESKASSVVLAHNHPGGFALPSTEDDIMTHQIGIALYNAEVMLIDHIIFTDDSYISMEKTGRYCYDSLHDMSITV